MAGSILCDKRFSIFIKIRFLFAVGTPVGTAWESCYRSSKRRYYIKVFQGRLPAFVPFFSKGIELLKDLV